MSVLLNMKTEFLNFEERVISVINLSLAVGIDSILKNKKN